MKLQSWERERECGGASSRGLDGDVAWHNPCSGMLGFRPLLQSLQHTARCFPCTLENHHLLLLCWHHAKQSHFFHGTYYQRNISRVTVKHWGAPESTLSTTICCLLWCRRIGLRFSHILWRSCLCRNNDSVHSNGQGKRKALKMPGVKCLSVTSGTFKVWLIE